MRSNAFLMLTAIVSLSVLGVGAIVGLIVVGPSLNGDSTPLIAAILGFLAPTIVSLLTLIRLEHNTEVTQQNRHELQVLKKDGFDKSDV